MSYDFSSFKKASGEAAEWLGREFASIRTGRASPAVLDAVSVEAWGSTLPLKQVAAITLEDARTLLVSPWDKEQAKAIEKAIITANLGLSAVPGDAGIRVIFPEVSSERRAALLKTAKAKAEEVRVSVRRARDEALRALAAAKKAGEMGEDDEFRHKKELEKLVEGEMKKIDDALIRKEKEINA